ncbi:ubiquitin carboxyl-terminal hydrolase 18 [Syzygium oleosum]|uniref:ubiquitin carboxyl-terminal hydrolase 18 n=1 Tax=Syzygium oleosum TaxID=219896 RepID=UPI0011D1BA26|nr:ubiquitin carboxyl-terminal hydrolase 18 [Syzygium oleosum]
MHVLGFTLDLYWFLQLIFTAFLISFGLIQLLKSTASKYFEVEAGFEGAPPTSFHADRGRTMPGAPLEAARCVVCGDDGPKKCSRCKAVRYCSQTCQTAHWKSEHKSKCKVFQASSKVVSADASPVTQNGTPKPIKRLKKILFPYKEFVDLYNSEKAGFPPCGLINCGNSCFANVVLQCLASTRPLVAYLLNKGHRKECRRNDWCFLCELQSHLERASQSLHAFSPINILSRLPNIGGNLGYGRQEDAHEFMRFAIDTMQSVCLDEFGGERAVHPSAQETTIIQHMFGGHLQSQVICANCNKVSNQYENMMDLTVEIHGDAGSLEECLEQFTVKEWLHGDNMYKCDGCNDYVKAWKRLTVRHAPNILTIALKRFQSGRFGKLNKKVNFPETLDLSPYMSEGGDGTDVYKLYAVVVHVDMLNASFFGHYICYTKDFSGNWYRIDDCKVTSVGFDEVLSQGAYMLLYSRVSPRPSCLMTAEISAEENHQKAGREIACCSQDQSDDSTSVDGNSVSGHSSCEALSTREGSQDAGAELMDIDVETSSVSPKIPNGEIESLVGQKGRSVTHGAVEDPDEISLKIPLYSPKISSSENGPSAANNCNATGEDGDVDMVNLESGPSIAKDGAVYCNGHKDLRVVSGADLDNNLTAECSSGISRYREDHTSNGEMAESSPEGIGRKK